MGDILYPLYRDPLFAKAKHMDDYAKLKELYQMVCSQINRLDEKIETHGKPMGPRQDILQKTDKNTHRILLRRKERLEKQMADLAESIKKDIDTFNGKL